MIRVGEYSKNTVFFSQNTDLALFTYTRILVNDIYRLPKLTFKKRYFGQQNKMDP